MALLKIAHLGNPLLRERSPEVREDKIRSDKIQKLIRDMLETMRDAYGAGIAAPQVYSPVRVCMVEVNENPRYPGAPQIPLHILINPVIVQHSNETNEDWEGCLSINGIRGLVPRYNWVVVSASDREANSYSLRADGFFARAIQHEIDHLDGYLFIDRMPDLTTLTEADEYRKFWTHEGTNK